MSIERFSMRLICSLCLILPGAAMSEQFSIMVLPDTQFYAQNNSPIFDAQTQWIVTNQPAAAENIIYVAHLGDLKDSGGPTSTIACNDVDLDPGVGVFTEWDFVAQALAKLEDPVTTGLTDGIPYGVLPGNHDFDQQLDGTHCPGFMAGAVDGRPLTKYVAKLGTAHFAGKGYYGGTRPPDPTAESMITFTGDSYTLVLITFLPIYLVSGVFFLLVRKPNTPVLAPSESTTARA